jgi:hypothetical protein
MRKLLIISGSSRMTKEPLEPIPAVQRFDGVLMRSTRKHARKLKNVDILILSPRHGFILPQKKIPYDEPIGEGWKWNKDWLPREEMEAASKANLRILRGLLSRRKYDEVYVNVGKKMLQLIEGFEDVLPQDVKLTYARGGGMGPKMAHMKSWMEQQQKQ